jgi:hypothetical protein
MRNFIALIVVLIAFALPTADTFSDTYDQRIKSKYLEFGFGAFLNSKCDRIRSRKRIEFNWAHAQVLVYLRKRGIIKRGEAEVIWGDLGKTYKSSKCGVAADLEIDQSYREITKLSRELTNKKFPQNIIFSHVFVPYAQIEHAIDVEKKCKHLNKTIREKMLQGIHRISEDIKDEKFNFSTMRNAFPNIQSVNCGSQSEKTVQHGVRNTRTLLKVFGFVAEFF